MSTHGEANAGLGSAWTLHEAHGPRRERVNHRREEWVTGTESAIDRLTKDGHNRPQWLAEAREEIPRELKEIYI
jgi:hypothetical protein